MNTINNIKFRVHFLLNDKLHFEYLTLDEIEFGMIGNIERSFSTDGHKIQCLATRDIWIGKKDKNGKDIYYGDITDDDYVIDYDDNSGSFYLWSDDGCDMKLEYFNSDEWGIKGNIYEKDFLITSYFTIQGVSTDVYKDVREVSATTKRVSDNTFEVTLNEHVEAGEEIKVSIQLDEEE